MNKMKKTKGSKPGNMDWRDHLLALILGVFFIGLYIRTLAPGLLQGDSGEFQILAYRLGHAHTTGYSVYLIMAKLFTFLPIGNIAYRVNMFSAFMGGITLGNLYSPVV
jgi:hypothetical protein